MPKDIQILLKEYLIEIQKIYGSHLKSVILYGSYARGDFTPDSDVDIMILVDLKDEEMDQYSDALSELGFEYNIDHDLWMMPVVKNIEHFQHWVSVYPFYKNVQKEGVTVYEAA
ncbi:MAG: nucleotidyltransferase domain-containing protein [Clostridiales bacterium]|nr:nucleotidyltransferase domain-containing protein [Clostridiales bacterium]